MAGALAYRLFIWLLPLALVAVAGLGYASDAARRPKAAADSVGLAGIVSNSVASGSKRSSRAYALLVGIPLLIMVTRSLLRTLIVAHRLIWTESPARASPSPRRVQHPVPLALGAFLAISTLTRRCGTPRCWRARSPSSPSGSPTARCGCSSRCASRTATRRGAASSRGDRARPGGRGRPRSSRPGHRSRDESKRARTGRWASPRRCCSACSSSAGSSSPPPWSTRRSGIAGRGRRPCRHQRPLGERIIGGGARTHHDRTMSVEPVQPAYGDAPEWSPAAPRLRPLRLLVAWVISAPRSGVAAGIVPGVALERPGARLRRRRGASRSSTRSCRR